MLVCELDRLTIGCRHVGTVNSSNRRVVPAANVPVQAPRAEHDQRGDKGRRSASSRRAMARLACAEYEAALAALTAVLVPEDGASVMLGAAIDHVDGHLSGSWRVVNR